MRFALPLACAFLFLGAACGGNDEAPAAKGAGGASGKLETIASVPDFAEAFDGAKGHPRLVLLLSPT